MDGLGGETCKFCLKYILQGGGFVAALDEEVIFKLEFLQIRLVSIIFRK